MTLDKPVENEETSLESGLEQPNTDDLKIGSKLEKKNEKGLSKEDFYKILDIFDKRLGTKKDEEKKDDDDIEEAKHWAMNQKQSLARNKPASN